MRRYHLFKIVQLSILAIFLALCVVLLLSSNMKQMVFAEPSATVLFFVVWVILLANFIFIFIDFCMISFIKQGSHELYQAAYSDSIGAIPNRYSCDAIIEKYFDRDLPDGIGCMMMSISNLFDVNNERGRKAGNQVIKDFSSILTNAAGDMCFAGRNGGNKFLAVFEDCDQEKFDAFLHEVESRISAHNSNLANIPIEYSQGIALSTTDDVRDITKLIALSDRRLMEK